VDQTPARVLLVVLPPGERRLEFAEPMGTPAVLSARIAELLPGTVFDAERRGTFRRGGYEMVFEFIAENTAIAQATGVVVTIARGDGYTALKRIVEKTGWQAVDPATLNPVDLDKSRAAGSVAVQSADAAPTVRAPRPSGAPRTTSPRKTKASLPIVPIAIGVAVLLVAGIAATRLWSRGTLFSRTAPLLASELAAGPPPYIHLPVLPKGDEARKTLAPQFVLAAEEVRGRLERLQELAPEFRADEIVHQLIQFRDASIAFPAKVGENGFMSPEHLSDAAFFAQLHAAPRLPAWFAEPQRDGYVFDFTGDDCTWRAHMVELGTLCFGFTYSARPIDTRQGKRSYALFSADQKIHYHTGQIPTQNDPVVEATPATSGDAAETSQQPAMQEAFALRDLRHAASAEKVVVSMLGRGYVNPERLADRSKYYGGDVPPMLPAYFLQSSRQGYTFQFNGNNPLRAPTPFGQAYESFVYSAVPSDQKPGRRSFALYPGGKIYATSERRVPTPNDAAVDVS
jgi:hypothetical protein